jgi:hypothetical protein
MSPESNWVLKPACAIAEYQMMRLTTRKLAQASACVTLRIPRASDEWRCLYRRRSAVEREFGNLKHNFGLAFVDGVVDHRTDGGEDLVGQA